MADQRMVSEELFLHTAKTAFTAIHELLIIQQGLQVVLLGTGVMNSDQFLDAVDRLRAGEKMTRIAKSIAKLRKYEDVEDILKDFDGPIQ